MTEAPTPETIMNAVNLGRFGHHPDPAVDFSVEVEAIQGMIADFKVGHPDDDGQQYDLATIKGRIFSAMTFRVGGDAGAVHAKSLLRQSEAELLQ